jgi:Domain of unknown function (DUF4265)
MTSDDNDVAVHQEPIWRDRANSIIMVDVSDEGNPPRWEQLWPREVESHRYQLCCIPFFAYDLALGDIVDTETKGEHQYAVRSVVEESGHSTFRIWFGNSSGPDGHREGGIHHRVLADLTAQGALMEWSSHNLLAVDVEPKIVQQIPNYLWGLEQQGTLEYETGMMHERKD